MRLNSRYILVVNAVILTAMTAFFVIDDIRMRRSHIEAVSAGTVAGVRAREIADRVVREVQEVVSPARLVEDVRRDVHAMRNDAGLEGVLDVRVTVSVDEPKVIASLMETAEGTTLELGQRESEQLRTILTQYGGPPSGIIVGMRRYRDVWSTRLIIPYTWDALPTGEGGDTYAVSVGLIEILIDSDYLPHYWESFRIQHLLFVVLLAATLTAIIDVTTDRIVRRPLRRLTEIIHRGKRGEVDADAIFPNHEVGQVSAMLTDMLVSTKALHEDRVASLERLASGVAHEIRNPLNAISMSALYLRDVLHPGTMSAEQHKDADDVLAGVSDAVKQMNQITNQFLSLNRPERMDWTMGDLREQVAKVLNAFALPIQDAGIQVTRDFPDDLPPVAMDIVRLRSAFYNLAQNAIDAMPDGGELAVRIYTERGSASAALTDSGVGMSQEDMAHIFDPYFTTRERQGGTGLGLTLAQHAINQHHGRIQVSSDLGRGTTFVVTLPLRADRGERISDDG